MADQVGRLSVRVSPDASKFRDELKATLEQLERSTQAVIDLGAELSRTSIEHIEEQLGDLDTEVTVDADADTAAAQASIAAVARNRTVTLNAVVNPASLAAASAALTRFSGTRVFGDMARNIGDALSNLDRFAASAITTAPAIASLGAVGLTGLTGLAQTLAALGSGLAQVAPLALGLPGVLAGVSVSFVALGSAVSVAKENLAGFADDFSAINKATGDAAWAAGGVALTRAIERILPVLSEGMTAVGTGMGQIIAAVSDAATSTQGLQNLQQIFADIADSMTPMASAAGAFTSALLSITQVGTSLLPELNSWLARVGENFANWAHEAAESGEMVGWITNAVDALKTLGSIAADVGGIIAGLGRAMGATDGASHLDALAESLDRVHAAIDGPAFQGALTTVFTGAGDAMRSLQPALDAIGDAFVALAPTIATLMTTAAPAFSTFVEAIAGVVSRQEFMGGLIAAMEGLAAGLVALSPAIAVFGGIMEQLGPVIGVLGEELGGVLAEALVALAPIITELLRGMETLVPVMADLLVDAIRTLAPMVLELVTAIVDWVQQNPELAGGLLMAVGALAGLAAAVLPLLSALGPVVGLIATLGPVVTAAVSAIAPFTGIILGVVGALGAIGAAVVLAKDDLAGLGAGFMDAVGQSQEALSGLGAGFMDAVGSIGATLRPLADAFLGLFEAIGNRLLQLGELIGPYLIPILRGVGDFIGRIFSTIGEVIAGAITLITGAINMITGLINGNLAQAFNGVRQMVSGTIDAIGSLAQGIYDMLETVVGWMLTLGNNMMTGLVNGIADMATPVISAITGIIGSIVDAAKSLLGIHSPSTVFADIGTNTGRGFVKGVEGQDAAAHNAVSSLVATPDLDGIDVGGVESGGAAARGGGSVVNVYNPINEPTSKTIRTASSLITQGA